MPDAAAQKTQKRHPRTAALEQGEQRHNLRGLRGQTLHPHTVSGADPMGTLEGGGQRIALRVEPGVGNGAVAFVRGCM